MKKLGRSVLGVTLLEIMLVLAIAAMIIVMSVRYYQSATSSQQANTVLQTIQAITASADSLAQGTGSYAAITSATITNLLPTGTLTSPWGSTIALSAFSATGYTVTIPNTPVAVCPLIAARLTASSKYSVTSTCGSSAASFVYTYNANA